MSDYVRNCWYMAGWADEVPDGGWLARRLLDQPWLVLRLADGGYTMLADRCPHRFAPLSLGERVGDTVRCGYHGLGFDAAGRCIHEPFGGTPPQNARVASLPVIERHGALWFWPGNPALADPATIADFAFCTGPEHLRAHFTMQANYELVTDNLMDLSHAEFLHKGSFGTNGTLLRHGRQTVLSEDDGAIWNNWDITQAEPPEWAKPMLGEGARINQTLHIRWHAPATMALFITLEDAATGQPIVPAMANPHIITPETPDSSHYFFTREHGPEAEALFRKAFIEEDEPMVEAVHRQLGGEDFWDARPVVLPTDAAAIRARRRLMQLRRAEAGAEPSAD
ncbi:aromatic ring-hydroxylating dioxygenase subunit alpha [Novosphingobium sp.]|uniref:aromatic ring-hydroxylating dioxygenase subunit alpha n=1 Tax=Novosphingobium sp. TaxID=1874826 RepID=UPI0026295D7A|nr:aromatic ring-hydroxylating dioxygenase subunit alpha [Novosphingobium sp.]